MKTKTGILIVALLAVALMSGCYSMNGWIIEENKIETEPVGSTTETVPLPDENRIEIVSAEFVGSTLKVKAEYLNMCEEQTTTTIRRKAHVKRKLPASYWVWYSLSWVGLAGGAAMGGTGTYYIQDGNSRPIGTSAQEKNRDTGEIIMPVGYSLMALSAVLIGVQSYDLYKARDTTDSLPDEEDIRHGDPQVCKREPAEKAELMLAVGDYTMKTIQLDANGRGSLEFDGSWFRQTKFQVPFAKLSCNLCKQQYPLDLPAGLAAELVLAHNNEKELRRWIREFGDEHPPHSEKVAQALRAIGEAEAQQLEASTKEHFNNAKSAERKGDWYTAAFEARRCLAKDAGHDGCKRILAASKRQKKLIPHHIKKIAMYNEGNGFMIYYSLVNSAGEEIAVPGKAVYRVVIEERGAMIVDGVVGQEKVSREDYQQVQIGPGIWFYYGLIHSHYVDEDAVIEGAIPRGWDKNMRPSYIKLMRNDGHCRIYVKIEFTDPWGKTHTSREQIWPDVSR